MKARAQGPLSLRTCSLRTRVPNRIRCPAKTSLDKRLRVITRGADDTCALTAQIGYIGTVWPRFLAGLLAARLASWYHLAWSSLLLPCQANRLTARGCCIQSTAVVSACRTVSEHFTYFPWKYVKSHFSCRVNGLGRAHYFFTEVERMTKHIVIREIRDNRTRELARVSLSRAVTSRWMPGALAPARSSCRRCSSNSASTRHPTFAITNLLITDVGTTGRDIQYIIVILTRS